MIGEDFLVEVPRSFGYQVGEMLEPTAVVTLRANYVLNKGS